MIFHLDANGVITWSRGRDPKFDARLSSTAFDELAISYVVEAELRVGLLKSHYPAQHTDLLGFLASVRIVHSNVRVVRAYAQIRTDLERSGMRIGDNDLWIAATALSENATLVTHNTREFARIPELKIEDWQTSV